MIQQVQSNATNAVTSMPYGPDRDVLKYKLADIDRRFSAVSEKSTQRKQTLDSIQPLTEQYREVMNAFLIYLDSAEDKLESLKKAPRDEEGAARHKADAQVTRELCVSCCLVKGCVTSCYSDSSNKVHLYYDSISFLLPLLTVKGDNTSNFYKFSKNKIRYELRILTEK